LSSIPIGHSIWDPHFSASINEAYSSSNTSYGAIATTSGLYNYLLTVGFRSDYDIYVLVLALEIAALICILLGRLHLVYIDSLLLEDFREFEGRRSTKSTYTLEPFVRPYSELLAFLDGSGLRLNYHLGALFGMTCLAWGGHIVHVAIPASRGVEINWGNVFSVKPVESGLADFYHFNWSAFSRTTDLDTHIFGSASGAGTSILTFIGGLSGTSYSLFLTDIAHHHLALGVLLIWSGNFYRSVFLGLGHRISDVIKVNAPLNLKRSGATGVLAQIATSLNLQLSLALSACGVITSVVAQHMYAMNPYAFLSFDYVATVCLYVHHQYIASLLMAGAFAHAAIFLVRDYTMETNSSYNADILGAILRHKGAIISHLSWICLFLGFHTLLVYCHNDTVTAFGTPDKSLSIEPVFAQCIQFASGKALYGYGIGETVAKSNWFNSLNGSLPEGTKSPIFNNIFLPIGPGDFMAHHAIALGLHVSVLILLKGALDARGSKLMPDKVHYGYAYACDGPGRGGTCDISSWDSFYLAMFWILNTDAWLMFYFHWKHLAIWANATSVFEESSVYLNGWFRDYLWFNSGCLIRGYDASGVNDLSVWDWLFLAAHLCWAVGFMFLISWRGFWQELIDVIIYMHLRTPIVYDIWNSFVFEAITKAA
jgi:photosystem I P700 chlorophyll a apoprotein A2